MATIKNMVTEKTEEISRCWEWGIFRSQGAEVHPQYKANPNCQNCIKIDGNSAEQEVSEFLVLFNGYWNARDQSINKTKLLLKPLV